MEVIKLSVVTIPSSGDTNRTRGIGMVNLHYLATKIDFDLSMVHHTNLPMRTEGDSGIKRLHFGVDPEVTNWVAPWLVTFELLFLPVSPEITFCIFFIPTAPTNLLLCYGLPNTLWNDLPIIARLIPYYGIIPSLPWDCLGGERRWSMLLLPVPFYISKVSSMHHTKSSPAY